MFDELKKAIRENAENKLRPKSSKESSIKKLSTKSELLHTSTKQTMQDAADEVIHEGELSKCRAGYYIPRWARLTHKHFVCFDSQWSALHSHKKPLLVVPLKSIKEVRRLFLGNTQKNWERAVSALSQKACQFHIEILLKKSKVCSSIASSEKSQNEIGRKVISEEAKHHDISNDKSEMNDLNLIVDISESQFKASSDKKPMKRRTDTYSKATSLHTSNKEIIPKQKQNNKRFTPVTAQVNFNRNSYIESNIKSERLIFSMNSEEKCVEWIKALKKLMSECNSCCCYLLHAK
eukprot:TRINITY_DN2189_c0_g2_i1.p1 TRINITY_DN2189_c0_g2~~TRINITY_DN2189_c0_g2_i1.p1  ORF type:complete len:292 (+),score=32.17 TRINITY_DN2189_c0_g2_i1:336-1211(+)